MPVWALYRLNDFVFKVTVIEGPYGNWWWFVWNFIFQEPDIIFSWNTNSFHCYIPLPLLNWGNRTGGASLKIYIGNCFRKKEWKKLYCIPEFCFISVIQIIFLSVLPMAFSMMLYAFWQFTGSKSFWRWHNCILLTSDLGYNVFRTIGVSLH